MGAFRYIPVLVLQLFQQNFMANKIHLWFILIVICSCNSIENKKEVNLVSAEDSSNVKDEYNQVKKLIEKAEYDSALIHVNDYEEYSSKVNYRKGIGDACYQRGIILSRQNNLDSASANYTRSLDIRQQEADTTGVGKLYNQIAIVFKNKGNYDSALAYCKISEDYFKISHDTATLGRIYNTYGTIYGEMNRNEEAMNYFLKKAKLDEMTGDSSAMMITYENIAVLHQNLHNYKAAIKFFETRIEYCIEKEEVWALNVTYKNLGHCFLEMENYDSALFYLNKGLMFVQEESFLQANLLGEISTVNLLLNNFDSAYVYAQAALKEAKKKDNPRGLFFSHSALADLYATDKTKGNRYYNPRLAVEHYKEAGKIAKAQGDNTSVMSSYRDLSKAYYKNNQLDSAFASFESYYYLKDSMDQTDYRSKVAEMETKYETEKKESEITRLTTGKLLDAEKIARQRTLNYSLFIIAGLILVSGFMVFNSIQKKRTAEKQVAILEKQNAIENMRSKIASDVHDDIGANLTRMGLNAQQLLISAQVPEKEKQTLEKIAVQSKEVITGMREIIWASNPANDNLKSMLGFMRQYIDRFFDGTNIRPIVKFPHDAGEITLHPEVRRNLFLILKESLHNAIKYSDSDKIDIDFSNENENFKLNIKDYGKGMDNKSKDDFSNGLRNMQMRAEQIQSLFKLISAPGQGVHITVEGRLY